MSRNTLDKATSPYLLQHKDNPVHWRSWGPDALAEAEASGKPILLSVGYAACHWCHVMAHESFEDEETAALMNANFVNVKVDREERPDVDLIYQGAVGAFGARGGWPLTAFLTPKGELFYGGTYFPKEPQPGQPAFKDVLTEVMRLYKEHPDNVARITTQVSQALNTTWARNRAAEINPSILDVAAIRIAQRYDIFYGGITGAPKFPNPRLAEVLWRAHLRTGGNQFLQLLYFTLDHICLGGIYDHVGGGFYRYAVDERWIIPHFEKMLYDNALLIDLLTSVWQNTRRTLYRRNIEDTIGWAMREMRLPGGAFASSLDADSEGEEGKYYLWSEAEIDAALKGTFIQRFKDVHSITRGGNFNGKNIIHCVNAPAISEADEALFVKQREMLRKAREARVRPTRDDKVLADWNGLMIAALATAGAVFRNPEWSGAAVQAFEFVAGEMGEGGRLCHAWLGGRRGQPGFAEDYANMIRAAFALWEYTGEKPYLDKARKWAETLDSHFWDIENGGYFQTPDDGERLILRVRSAYDQEVPNANGTMISMHGKLYAATGDQYHRDRANALIQAFGADPARNFISMPSYLNGLDDIVNNIQVVIVGRRDDQRTQELVATVLGRSLPGRVMMVVDPDEAIPAHSPAAGKTMQDNRPTAYICRRNTCSAPIVSPVNLSQALTLPAKPQANA